jgi:hypothetical protein
MLRVLHGRYRNMLSSADAQLMALSPALCLNKARRALCSLRAT